MSLYAEIQNTTLIKYPYGIAELQVDNPYTNYGQNPDLVALFPGTDIAVKNGYALAPVTIAAQPAFDPATQTCTQNDLPALVGDTWTLGWTVAAMTTDQLQVATLQAAQAAYGAAISTGVVITSTSTPSLNGTYAITPPNQAAIAAVMAGIGAGQGLPGSQLTFNYLDAAGAPHLFTAAQFTTLGVAIRDFVYACDLAAAGVGSIPSNAVTIP